jgi:hypothetical protein
LVQRDIDLCVVRDVLEDLPREQVRGEYTGCETPSSRDLTSHQRLPFRRLIFGLNPNA